MKYLIKILFFINLAIFPQGVFEPVNSDVYDYLERQNLNGKISFNYEIKPVTRIEIARHLMRIDEKINELSELDKEFLEFYKTDFFHELNLLLTAGDPNPRTTDYAPEFLVTAEDRRMRLFEYAGSDFSFFADPLLSASLESVAGDRLFVRRNGFSAYGYVLNNWAFDLRFYDNEESGKNLDIYKNLTPIPGTSVTKLKKEAVEYDIVNASLGYYWGNGSFTIGKDYFKFGNGRTGNLILSDKAPSFPFIRFDLKPVDWLRFLYFHGFLVSNVIDSSSIRYSSLESRISTADVPKFLAFHSLSFYPSDNISITVGESIVYSENIQPVYFIPVMFFRVADHYLSKGNSSSTGNAQLFADASYINTSIQSKFYGSLFIDELSFNSLFSGGNLSALGFTIGTEKRDLIFNQSKIIIEYSRLNPFVYMNSVNAQTYANDDYMLGHWIGSNGDILSFIYHQYLKRSLSLRTEINYIRKGKTELAEEQYMQPYPPFLYGERLDALSFELSVKYRPYHPVTAQAYYRYEDITDKETGRLPVFRYGSNHCFGFSLSYGF